MRKSPGWRTTIYAAALILYSVMGMVSPPLFAAEVAVQVDSLDSLAAELRRQTDQANATVGVSLLHLESGAQIAINGDEPFPLASTYKVPMAATALSLIDRGELSLDEMIVIPDSARVGSSIISQYFPHTGVSLSLFNLMDLMLRESDNTATDVFLSAVGGSPVVMTWLRHAGIEGLRVDRSTAQLLRQFAGLPEPDPGVSIVEQTEALVDDPRLNTFFEDGSGTAYLAYLADPQDQGSPNAMSLLLARLWRGELLSPANTLRLQEVMLGCNTGNQRLKGRLPEGTPVAHKSGTISATVNDVGVITLPQGRGDLVISVLVKEGMGSREEHEQIIADIARTAYDYFVLTLPPKT